MRINLTCLLLLTVLLQVSQASFAQKLTLSEKNASLEQVLNAIQNQSGYRILYGDEVLAKAKPVNVRLKNAGLTEALQKCFEGQPLTYLIKEKTIIVRAKEEPILSKILNLFSSSINITGLVTDQKDLPLQGVKVVLKGTPHSTSTDMEGKFTLQSEEAFGTLVFTYLGFTTKEVAFSSDNPTVVVKLDEETTSLNEVVVVGYGTQKKSSMTAAVSTVNMEDIANTPKPNVVASLEGRVAGLTISETNSEPGSSPDMLVRGVGTIDGATAPLVLIDGSPSGSLSNLAPGDIESISVLKDAAAAAIYGARAANGVILVTTKKGGQMDKAVIEFNHYTGIQSPTRMPKTINSYQYATLINETAANEGRVPVYTVDDLRLFQEGTDQDMHANTNWLDEITQRNAPIVNNYVSASGNSAIGRYFVSGEYLYQKGSVKEIDHYNRINLRANVTSKISDKLELQVLTSYLRGNRDAAGTMGIFSNALRASPTSPVKFSDGHWGGEMFANGNYLWSTSNQVAVINNYGPIDDNQSTYNITGSLNYKPVKGLTLNGMVNMQAFNSDSTHYTPRLDAWDLITRSVSQAGVNSLQENWSKSNKYNLQATATYEQSWGDHYFKVLGGYSQESYRADYIRGYRKDFINDELYELDAGDAASQTNMGFAGHWAFMSGFGRVNYSYQDKYLFEATGRYDGSSRLAPGHRWGFFPSASVGWNMQKEDFLKNWKNLDLLKLRFSIGQLGNAEKLGFNESYANLSSGPLYNFDGSQVIGVRVGNPANPNLTWETTTTYNLGLDGSYHNGLLAFEFDLWRKVTNDILLSVPVSTVVGLPNSSITTNAGKVGAHGFDLMVSHHNRISNDFSYDATFTISGWKSWVIDLQNRATPFSTEFRPNGDLGNYYGYETLGIINSEEQLNNYKNIDGVVPQVSLGDLMYKDQNGDGRLDYMDVVKVGNKFVKTQYGLNLGIRYKSFDLSAFFQGAFNTDRILNDYIRSAPANYNSPLAIHLDRWTPENRNADAAFPRTLQNYDFNRSNSDWWIKDGSYIRLKTLQVGYSLPQNTLNNLKLQSLRVFLSATNLFTYAPNYVDGFDPERDIIDTWYPTFRVISLRVNLKF